VSFTRAFFASAALAFASPAHAEQQVLEGVYTYHQEGGPSGTYTIFPSCVPTVGDLREPLYLPVGHAQRIPQRRMWHAGGSEEIRIHAGIQGATADTRRALPPGLRVRWPAVVPLRGPAGTRV
jgi:hypothetical protein